MASFRRTLAPSLALVVGIAGCASEVPEPLDESASANEVEAEPAISTEGPLDPEPAPEGFVRREPVILPAVTALAREVRSRSPGTILGLAVYDYTTREYAAAGDETTHVSASSAKAIWVAAALKRSTVAKVRPHAEPIFETSSNDDATKVIQIAGPNYLNDYYRSAGMTKSAFTQWFGQRATNSPDFMGGNNYFTAKDNVAFLHTVFRGTLLDAPKNTQLREWMTTSPRTGYGGWIGTLLPASARGSMMHKAGWLPPPYESKCHNEIGLVDAGGGHWYAISILARHASDYDKQRAFVEHASCVVHEAIAGVSLDCR